MNDKQIYELQKKAIEIDQRFKEDLVNKIIQAIPKLDNQTIIKTLKESLQDIKIIVPEIKIPEIKSPKVEIPKIEVKPPKIPDFVIPPIKVPKPEITIKQEKPKILIKRIETERIVEKFRDSIKLDEADLIIQNLKSLIEIINNKIGNDELPIPVRITNSFLGGIGLDFTTIENLLESILNTISTSSQQDQIINNQEIIITRLNSIQTTIDEIKNEQILQSIPFGMRLSLGLKPGFSAAIISGRSSDIPAGQWVEVWKYGGKYNWMETGANLYLSSSEETDNQIIGIFGLDDEYNEHYEFVQLNGHNPVLIPNINFRINQMLNRSETRTGDIYAAEEDTLIDGVPQTPEKVKAFISTDDQYSHAAIYTTSNRYGGTLVYTNRSTNKGKDLTLEYAIKPPGGVFTSFPISELYERTEVEEFKDYGGLPPMSDFMISAYAYNNDTRISISGVIDLIDITIYAEYMRHLRRGY